MGLVEETVRKVQESAYGHPVQRWGSKFFEDFQGKVNTGGVRGQLSKFSQLADMFGSEAGRSYLDTTEGKSFTSMIEKASKRRKQGLDRSAGMLGLTGESYLAGLGQINEAEGDSMSQLVSGADARRSNLRSQQMAALSQVLGGEQGLMGAQQNQLLSAYGMGANIYGADQAREAQSDQNTSNLFGSFLSSLIPIL